LNASRSRRRLQTAPAAPRTSARRRRLGQHFLRDARVLDRIVAAFDPAPADRVLEVGPGDGALTERLAGRVARLLAVEVDGALARRLAARWAAPSGVEILEGDILQLDLDRLAGILAAPVAGSGPPAEKRPGAAVRARAVGNLPYRIATPLLARLLRRGDLFADVTVMVQREVAVRLLARPGEADYGPLAVLAALCADSRRALLDAPPGAFSPPPAVHSRVIALELGPVPPPATAEAGLALAREAFQQRRKKLVNALAGAERTPQRLALALADAGLQPDVRPGALAPDDWVGLAAALAGSEAP
jgi:16S rRNA (adenine1518-N6/adenine1519-N6)-dimethyltransferase